MIRVFARVVNSLRQLFGEGDGEVDGEGDSPCETKRPANMFLGEARIFVVWNWQLANFCEQDLGLDNAKIMIK